MITEDFVSFEIAKLLEEKGFNESTIAFYINQELYVLGNVELQGRVDLCTKAPTLQMTMKWLREVHKLFIQIRIIPHTTITIEQKYYLFTIHKDRRTLAFRKDFSIKCYFTYEEACEEAIKYCLENLI